MDNRMGYQYSLHINGLFGRNRKPKFGTIVIAERFDELPIPPSTMDDLVRKGMEEMGYKSGRLEVLRYPFEEYAPGYKSIEITAGCRVWDNFTTAG